MNSAFLSCVIGITCAGATLSLFKIIHPDSPPGVYDNGLADWRQDTNHAYGVFISDCTRIVKLPSGKFQP